MSVELTVILNVFILVFCIAEINVIEERPQSQLELKILNKSDDIKGFFKTTNEISFINLVEPDEDWDLLYRDFVKLFNESYSFNYFTKSILEIDKEKYKSHLELIQYQGFIVKIHIEKSVSGFQMIFKRNGRYLVFLEEESGDEDKLLFILKEIWQQVGSCSILIWSMNKLYFLNPYVINEEKNHTFGVLNIYKAGLNFRRDLMKDLEGYPLRMEIFESAYNAPVYDNKKNLLYFQGPDNELNNIIFQQMNFSVRHQKPDPIDPFGARLPNGTFTGTLGRLITKKSDLAFTGFFIKDYLTDEIEFTSALYTDELCIITQKASRIPQYILPLICFKWDLWLCIGITSLFSILFWCCLRHMNNHMRGNPVTIAEYGQILVDTMILMISSPLRKFTKINSERLFIGSIVLISLIFVSIFQSGLSTVFIRPMYYKDIMTLEELETTGKEIHVKYQAMMDDVFPINGTGYLESLRKKMKLVNTGNKSIITIVSETGSIYAITRKSSMHLDNALYFLSKKAHLVPECPRIYNIAYVGRRHSIYLERINTIILQLRNGGFFEKWIRDLRTNYTWTIHKKYGIFYDPIYKVFSMTDLQLPFYLLFIGALISIVVFISEHFVKRHQVRVET